MYVSSLTELDGALRDCWLRVTEARSRDNAEASKVYLAQLDRLLDMRLQLREPALAALTAAAR